MYFPRYLAVGYTLARSSYLLDAPRVISAAQNEIDRQIAAGTFNGLPFDEVSLCVQVIAETDLQPRMIGLDGTCVGANVNLAGPRIQAMDDAERRIALCYTLIQTIANLVERYGGDTRLLEPIVEKYAHLPDGGSTVERLGALPSSEMRVSQDDVEDDLFGPTEITIEYRIEGFGTPDDLQKRYDVESVLNWALTQAGAGGVTGGEIGGGSMTVFCESDDPEYAVEIIKGALTGASLDAGATIRVGE